MLEQRRIDPPRQGMQVARMAVTGAVVGALVGVVIARDLDWSATASGRQCAHTTGVCLGAAPFAGLGIGLVVVIALCAAGFTLAGLRPVWAFVILGVFLAVCETVAYLSHVHGGRLHPIWEFAGVTALTFALVSLGNGLWQRSFAK